MADLLEHFHRGIIECEATKHLKVSMEGYHKINRLLLPTITIGLSGSIYKGWIINGVYEQMNRA